jgi:methyl-accepting chemotaxis protein
MERSADQPIKDTSVKIKNLRLRHARAAHPGGSSGAAMEGRCTAREAVGMMNPINESSTNIVDLIGVINGIAYQTNILALNAAAETARAGEHGERFAALAAEVRSLAQRAAAAVTEIKTLIGGPEDKAGAWPAEQAGMRITEVVTSIKRVSGDL